MRIPIIIPIKGTSGLSTVAKQKTDAAVKALVIVACRTPALARRLNVACSELRF